MKKVLSTFALVICVMGVFSVNTYTSINKTNPNPFGDIVPIAVNDNFTTNEDVVMNKNVSLNDTPSPDNPNIWTLLESPQHGSIIFNDNGQFQYTPALNFFGFDTLVYMVCDVDGQCDTASVFITINSVNEFPTAVNDYTSVNEDSSVSDTASLNDILSPDGGNVWSVAIQPPNGLIVVNNDGTYSYTPNANFYGNDTAYYKLCDINADCDTAMIIIVVNPVNDKPTANNDIISVNEDSFVATNVTSNDIDIDGGFDFTSIAIVTAPIHGSAVINSLTGFITYTPNANYNGTDSYVYKVCDDGTPLPSLCDTALVSITINPVNDIPLANTDYAYTTEYNDVTINVLHNDTFGGDGPCVCAITSTNGTHGTTSINNNGTPTNPTDDKVVYHPNSTYGGPDSFTYTIKDADGELSSATVYIDVTPMFAPTLTSPANNAVDQMPNTFLVWTAVPGAFSYKAQVSSDSLFTTTKDYYTSLTAAYSNELNFNTMYYWRVKAYSESDSSGWSDFKKFKVLKSVTITKPINGSQNRLLKMYFKWNTITGITNYEYEIDSSTAFTSPLFVTGVLAPSATATYSKELAFNTNYFLRMRAMHASDTSAWSSAINFHTINTINLLKPMNDTVNLSPVVKLEWKWVGSQKYEYALSKDSLFNDVNYTIVDSNNYFTGDTNYIRSYTDTLNFGQTYFWKVRGVNSYGTSGWSNIWKFKTQGGVILVSPTDGSVDVSTLPIFVWKKINNIGFYNMELDISSSFNNPTYYTFGKDKTADTVTTELLPLTVYYWRMRAATGADTSEWSIPFSFKTTFPIGLDNILSNDNISIYPNPSVSGKVNILVSSVNAQDINLSVVNMVGQEVYNEKLKVQTGTNHFVVNLLGNDNGIYFIRLQNDDVTLTRKIILNK